MISQADTKAGGLPTNFARLSCLWSSLQGYIVGAGLSGCATSLMSLLSQLQASSGGDSRTPADVAPAALVYFGSAAAITAVCCMSYALLTRLEYSRAKLGPYLASK